MSSTERFCQLLRKRSEENKNSFEVLFRNRLYGNCFSVLRQELDSMVNVIYLLNETDLSLDDLIFHLPNVMDKISSTFEYEMKLLEERKIKSAE